MSGRLDAAAAIGYPMLTMPTLTESATEADALAASEAGTPCELIDGRLVRKAVGRREAYLAAELITELVIYLRGNDLGFVCTPDLLMRFAPGLLYAPDVSVTRWDRCPGGLLPSEPIADILPNLVVEVLSPSNRPGEMARKLAAYFAGGVELVWVIDPATRSATVHAAADSAVLLAEAGTLDGGAVLPGFALPLAALFARLPR